MTNFDSIIGKVEAPGQVSHYSQGAAGIHNFLGVIVGIAFAGATVIFLFMILFAGYQWLMSGGDKEAIGKARGRLTNAIIGLAIIALAFFITRFVASVFNIEL